MKRPSIDRNTKYKSVRAGDVKVGDAITFEQPQPGVKYYRVTNIKQEKGRPVVYGYVVATKKKEDAGRPSKPVNFKSTRAKLIERTASDKPAEQPKPKDEKDQAERGQDSDRYRQE
jgi:hypothetical protein